jgi:hypothetical protein
MNLPNHVTSYVRLKCPYPQKSTEHRSMMKRLNAVSDGGYYRTLERIRADWDEYERPMSIDVHHSFNGKKWVAHLEGDDPFPAKENLPRGITRNGSGYRARVIRAGLAVFDQTFDSMSDATTGYRLHCRLKA